MTKTISARQFSLIAFLSIFSLKLTVLPSLLYSRVGVDALFSLFFIMTFDFIEFLIIFYVLKRNQDLDFYEFLCKKTGKIVAKILLVFIFAFYFFKMLLLCSGGFNYASQAIFKEAPRYLFFFILLISSGSLYLFKSRSFARTAEFFYPIIATIFVIFLGIALFTAPLQDIRPLLLTPAKDIFEASYRFSILGGNYLFMLLFMGKIKFGAKPKRTLFGHIIFGWVLLFAFYIIDYSIFKFTAVAHPHAISEIIQYLPIPSVLGNFDWFAVSFMLVLFVFHGGIFFYCMCYSANKIVQIKKVEKMEGISKIVWLCVNILIVIFLYLVFPTFSSLREFSFNTNYVSIISCINFAIPILCFLFAILESWKQKNRNKNKNINFEKRLKNSKLKILVLRGRKNEKNF